MKRIAVLASGGGTNLQAVMDGCQSGIIDGEIALVIYNRKKAYAKVRAEEAGIKSLYINRIQSGSVEAMQQRVYEALCEHDIDIVVLAGYLEKLDEETVTRFRDRIVNTHPSLIPMFCGEGYYGERVHQAVIDHGVKLSGCTIHLVDESYDTGPIILQQSVPVEQDDDAKSLAARILPVEHQLLVEAVKLLCMERIVVEGRRAYIK